MLVIWRSHGAIEVGTWYGSTLGGKLQPTLAGWWFGCVSLPLVQFILIEFDQKWLRGGVPADEALVGSADVNRWPI